MTGANTVRLVAGEDHRYTLTAPQLERWLPALMERLNGKDSLAALLAPLTLDERQAALEIVTHLYGERVLIDGTAADAHRERNFRVEIQGNCQLCDMLRERYAPAIANGTTALVILCQDNLDYEQS